MNGKTGAVVLLLALVSAPTAFADQSPLRVKWDGLGIVVGKTVAVNMPDGTVVSGRATAVEPDNLQVQVNRSSNPAAWPKGLTRVPRATLHTIEMRTKTARFRIIGTIVGFVGGAVGGAVAAIGVQGGILGNQNQGQAAATFLAITGAATAAGYFLGNSADRRVTTIEIAPD